jgi:hypothetical protein
MTVKMTKSSKYIMALALGVYCPLASAIDIKVEEQINSKEVLIKEVKVGEKIYETMFYSRPPLGVFENLENADYVDLWHGKDQTPYSLLNISGFTQKSADELRRLVLMGAEQVDFTREESLKLSRLIQMIKRPYLRELPDRRKYSVGYDLGVGGAFTSACTTGAFGAVLSSGGLYADETCQPKRLKVMYSINGGDQLYPRDKSTMFTSSDPYSLQGRLDAVSTENKLIDLMSCNSSPLNEEARGANIRNYSCDSGNELIVMEHQVNHHQWNGYLLVDVNTFNQYGSPYKIPLTNWIYSKMNLR